MSHAPNSFGGGSAGLIGPHSHFLLTLGPPVEGPDPGQVSCVLRQISMSFSSRSFLSRWAWSRSQGSWSGLLRTSALISPAAAQRHKDTLPSAPAKHTVWIPPRQFLSLFSVSHSLCVFSFICNLFASARLGRTQTGRFVTCDGGGHGAR